MSAANLAGVLLVWPSDGRPLAFFESDGVAFKATNLGATEAEADLADAAIADAIAWGEWPVEAPPEGWRLALGDERVGQCFSCSNCPSETKGTASSPGACLVARQGQ